MWLQWQCRRVSALYVCACICLLHHTHKLHAPSTVYLFVTTTSTGVAASDIGRAYDYSNATTVTRCLIRGFVVILFHAILDIDTNTGNRVFDWFARTRRWSDSDDDTAPHSNPVGMDAEDAHCSSTSSSTFVVLVKEEEHMAQPIATLLFSFTAVVPSATIAGLR
jgi:hypothetical protein